MPGLLRVCPGALPLLPGASVDWPGGVPPEPGFCPVCPGALPLLPGSCVGMDSSDARPWRGAGVPATSPGAFGAAPGVTPSLGRAPVPAGLGAAPPPRVSSVELGAVVLAGAGVSPWARAESSAAPVGSAPALVVWPSEFPGAVPAGSPEPRPRPRAPFAIASGGERRYRAPGPSHVANSAHATRPPQQHVTAMAKTPARLTCRSRRPVVSTKTSVTSPG